MKRALIAAVLIVSAVAQAAPVPAKVLKAAAAHKASDIRTIIKKTSGDGPCDLGYAIEIQVKQSLMVGPDAPPQYTWETVKSLGADKDGRVMDQCYE